MLKTRNPKPDISSISRNKLPHTNNSSQDSYYLLEWTKKRVYFKFLKIHPETESFDDNQCHPDHFVNS